MLDKPFSVFPNDDGSYMLLSRDGEQKRVRSFSNKLDLFVFLEQQFDLAPAAQPEAKPLLSEVEVQFVRDLHARSVKDEEERAWDDYGSQQPDIEPDALTAKFNGTTPLTVEELSRRLDAACEEAHYSTAEQEPYARVSTPDPEQYVDGIKLKNGDMILWKDLGVVTDVGLRFNGEAKEAFLAPPARPSALRRFLGNLRIL